MTSLTNEVPNQQSLENGYHVSSSGKLVQYKKRKVSAVRSFPPKCGINTEPVTPEALLDVIVRIDDHIAPAAQNNSIQSGTVAPEALLDVMVCVDDHVAPAAQDNSVQSGFIVQAESRVVEENQSIACGFVQCSDYSVAAVVNNVVEAEASKNPNGLEVVDLGLPKSPDQNNVAVPHSNATLATTCNVLEPKGAKSKALADKVDCSILTSEMEIQFDEAVGCPIFVENNVSLDDIMGDAFTMVVDSIDNQINGTNLGFNSLQVELLEDIKGNGTDLVKELSDKHLELKGIGEDVIKPSTESCVVVDKEIPVAGQTSRGKSTRKKFPVYRDFPPKCGRNGPPLTEVDRAKIFFETETLTGRKREYLQTNSKEAWESGKLRKTTSVMVEAGGSVKATNAGTEQSDRNLIEVAVTSDGLAEKEDFLYAPDTFGNVSSSGRDDDKRVIVAALTAAPNLPRVSLKATVSSEDGKMGHKGDKVNSKDRKMEYEVEKVSSEVSKIECKVDKVGSEDVKTELNSKEAWESKKLRKTIPVMVEAGGSVKATDAGTEQSDRNLIEVAVTSEGLAEKEDFPDAPDTFGKVSSSGLDNDKRVIVAALMAAPNLHRVLLKGTVSSEDGKMGHKGDKVNSEDRKTEYKVDKVSSELSKIEREVDKVGSEDVKTELAVGNRKTDWRKKSRVVAKKSIAAELLNRSPIKKQNNSLSVQKDVAETSVVKDRVHSDELQKNAATGHKNGFVVNIPPSGSSFSQHTDARIKVKEVLRLYHTTCRKLLRGEEARLEKFAKIKRIDLEAKKVLDSKSVEINTDIDRIGSVPGVEVGDEFQYRVELAIIGVHRLYQAGIDYVKQQDGKIVATSIVASGAYADGWDNADVLIYSGQGGNIVGKKKQPEDQKLERGNLALSNSLKTKNPVRVTRGWKETKASDSQDSKSSKLMTSYVYDGLYTVEKCWPETGPHGKMVYMFELRRIPGQPDLIHKEVKNAKTGKIRRGVCVTDISGGLENLPICAINLVDDEKPPAFTYIREMKYPHGFHFILPQGCSCTTRCSDSGKCSCRPRNGGELPYNRNGAIVEVKPIVYECGPSCKCPPTCYNRVSQHGIKIQLEIFKTENRGWGVRSLSSIPSGSFICEYAGELLDDKEAELRYGSDEYLFDIGKKNNLNPDEVLETIEESSGYTVDAAVYGNVGRFINHSCSPNLYAQDVLYDHNDKKMPHVMLFAADNIPPLQELTYDYNYSMNQVHDSNGNIKMKSCYCGSTECRGRLY